MPLNPCQLKEVAGGGGEVGRLGGTPAVLNCQEIGFQWFQVKKREFVFVVCFAFVLGVST